MFWKLSTLALVVAGLLTTPARAESDVHRSQPAQNASGDTLLIDDQPLDSSKSFALKSGTTDGYATLLLFVQFTHANNGALTFTCTWSDDGNTTDYTPQTCTVNSGTCTLTDAGVWQTASLSADKDFAFPVGLRGSKDLECTVAHGGTPTTSDKITVTGRLVTQ